MNCIINLYNICQQNTNTTHDPANECTLYVSLHAGAMVGAGQRIIVYDRGSRRRDYVGLWTHALENAHGMRGLDLGPTILDSVPPTHCTNRKENDNETRNLVRLMDDLCI